MKTGQKLTQKTATTSNKNYVETNQISEPDMQQILSSLRQCVQKSHSNASSLEGLGYNLRQRPTATENCEAKEPESGIIPAFFAELRYLSAAIDRQDAAIAHLQTIIG